MGENLSREWATLPAPKRALMLEKMRASRNADAPCFVYLFVLKEVAAIKVGISIDPLTRLANLPQFHLRIQDIFDLDRSIVVFAKRRMDARELERAVLRRYLQWKIDAPSGAVVYVDGMPTCVAPIRWSAGGNSEWLHSDSYQNVRDLLVWADADSPRPCISIAEWLRALQQGAVH